MERLLRIKEVASIISEDPQTIYARIRRGELKGTRLGKRGVRVSEPDLKAWIKESSNRHE